MGQAWAVVGGSLIALATVPQAVRLFRTRSAGDFTWPFIALNFAGVTFLGVRSVEIGEPAFVAVNFVASAFWLMAGVVKAVQPAIPATA